MTLDIVGDGPLRRALSDQVVALELTGSVRLLGARPPEEVRSYRGCRHRRAALGEEPGR